MWGGFVQGRLMARHGLLVGSLLTAVPFFLIHLPLAFENNGWQGTTWRDAFITWGVLLVAAPFQRYLIGTLLVDTGGSTLAAGLMHASINAAGAMVIVPGGWQMVPALILLTLGVVGYRNLRGRSATDGYAPALTPASEAAERTTLGADAVTAVISAPVAKVETTHESATTVVLHLAPGLVGVACLRRADSSGARHSACRRWQHWLARGCSSCQRSSSGYSECTAAGGRTSPPWPCAPGCPCRGCSAWPCWRSYWQRVVFVATAPTDHG